MGENAPEEIEKVLFDRSMIINRIDRIADDINRDYSGESVRLIVVLNGAKMFAEDLAKKLILNHSFDEIKVRSYTGTESNRMPTIVMDLKESVEGENVLIVEDLIDTGSTLKFLKEYLLKKNPKTLKLVSLMDKPSRREADIEIDYLGFEIPDHFVVGYGLDYNGRYRDLPFVGILKESVYKNQN